MTLDRDRDFDFENPEDLDEYWKFADYPRLIYEDENAPRDLNQLLEKIATGERFFQGSELSGQDLSGLDLSGLNFCGSNFSKCNLTETNFLGAALHVCDFSEATFLDANMQEADLSEADLSNTSIEGGSFKGSDCERASFSNTKVIDVDFSNCRFVHSSLYDSDWSSVTLINTIFQSCILHDFKISEPSYFETKLIDVNLTPFLKCPDAYNEKRDIVVDWRSVAQTINDTNLSSFLVSTGIPEIVVVYLMDSIKALDPEVLVKYMQTVFISYGFPDTQFARKLRNDLERNGVKTWFFEEDAEFGQKLHEMMRKNVNKHDKFILICSEASLTRVGVQFEVEQVLVREAREGGSSRIIPVSIDSFIFSNEEFNKTDASNELRSRVIADFSDPEKYDQKFVRLLSTLKVETPQATILEAKAPNITSNAAQSGLATTLGSSDKSQQNSVVALEKSEILYSKIILMQRLVKSVYVCVLDLDARNANSHNDKLHDNSAAIANEMELLCNFHLPQFSERYNNWLELLEQFFEAKNPVLLQLVQYKNLSKEFKVVYKEKLSAPFENFDNYSESFKKVIVEFNSQVG